MKLLEDCTIDDIDIISCCLKALTNLIFKNIKNDSEATQKTFSLLDQLLDKFGSECDLILTSNEINENEEREISELRNIINTIINVIPDQEFVCSNLLCKRKFKSYAALQDHKSRRHP